MLIVLHKDSERPVYEQIADAIKQQLFAGNLQEGDELPPVRTLAGLLHVNMHTVRHAYRILAEEGIITMRTGRRTRIRPRPQKAAITPEVGRELLESWRQMEQQAFLLGITASQLIDFILKTVEKGGVRHA